ncbi:MAG: O-methyltransferase [Ruminiclostridium sp.]|nr:O-methyltransferase [Clostridia bacterium]MBQ9483101.1 O-methyltransferase [Ruminiclostridium sp.]
MNITYDYIDEYISSLYSEENRLINEIIKFARERHIPVVCDAAALMLKFLCARERPARILEVGTAVGCSALMMYYASGSDPKIVTIERNEDMAALAKENIERAGLSGRIEIIIADAHEALSMQSGEFDFIFMDAAKGQYLSFLPDVLRLLSPSGLLVCDNVLIRGMVANDALVPHRHKTMTVNMRAFIDKIKLDPTLDFALLSVGDGMLLCQKKR